jgi:FtsP/CotA-like multicopper oxidase with cupredoxin domain
MNFRPMNRRQLLRVSAVLPCLNVGWAMGQDNADIQFLTATKTKSQLLEAESPPTEHWHFKTASNQPVIRAKQGQELRLKIANELDEPFWLHFFGVRGAAEMMTVNVLPGVSNALDVAFTPPDAGTFWFGPLLNASKHREMGLSGMLIVEEVLPMPYQDVMMIFDDWSLTDGGVIEADFANLNRAAGEGRLGNWFTVNGAHKPRITLDVEKPARLRLLNVANTRSMNVLFKGAEGVIIALDGQPVSPAALGLKALQLEPGQRADILLLDAQEQVVVALDLFEDVVEAAFLLAEGYGRKTLPLGNGLPLNPVSALVPTVTPREIALELQGGLKGGLVKANVGKDVLDLRAMLEQGLAWSIGGSAGLGSPPLFQAQKDEVLILALQNSTEFEQVLHIHGHVWLPEMPIVSVPEQSPTAPSWSDTLVIGPRSRQRVLMIADNPGTWAIQSLMAERSDAGLIGAFVVTDMP